MELKELEYIVAIADEGSINRAADALYMAQSSLSQFLSRYETELGTKLFFRTSGGVRPTPSGTLFLKNARSMLQQYHTVKNQLRELQAPLDGTINFGISTYRGVYLLPKVLCQFKQKAPTVDVIIHEHNSIHLQKMVSAGELDLALVAFLREQLPAGAKYVMQDEVLLVASRDHPVLQYVHAGDGGPDRPWVDLKEISHFEFLLSHRSTLLGSVAKQQFDRIGIEPKCTNQDLTAPFAAAMARRGLGLAFTYRSCIEESRDVIYMSISKERCFVDLALMYPPDGCRSRSVHALEKMIQTCIASDLI